MQLYDHATITSSISYGILGGNAATPLFPLPDPIPEAFLQEAEDCVGIRVEGEGEEESVQEVMAETTYLYKSLQQVVQLPTVHLVMMDHMTIHASHKISHEYHKHNYNAY